MSSVVLNCTPCVFGCIGFVHILNSGRENLENLKKWKILINFGQNGGLIRSLIGFLKGTKCHFLLKCYIG
jgi:hypothetical protein